MRRLALVLFLAVLLVAPCFAQEATNPRITTSAGTAALTYYSGYGCDYLSVAWTSSAGGAVTTVINPVYGEVLWVATNPGSTSPTANYDIVLTDPSGIDVLQGSCADRSATANEAVAPMVASSQTGSASKPAPAVRPTVVGPLTLSITNAGASKQGAFTLYLGH